jgi:hypothetical protein
LGQSFPGLCLFILGGSAIASLVYGGPAPVLVAIAALAILLMVFCGAGACPGSRGGSHHAHQSRPRRRSW